MHQAYLMVATSFVTFIVLTISVGLYQYVYPKKKIQPLALLLMFSVLPLISILRPGMPESGDFPLHTFFTMNFFNTLKDGNWLPQWASLAAGGYGEPFFIYMYHAPYYLGSFFHLIGFNFIDSTKLVFISSYLLSCITMYLWSKEEFGSPASVLATLCYQFAPYHLILLHFYTAYGEQTAFALLPFLFYAVRKYMVTQQYLWFMLIAGSFALAIISHLTLALTVLPFLAVYAFILYRKTSGSWKTLMLSYLGIGTGICLSGYYWIQLILESGYVVNKNMLHVQTQHFLDFFYSPWGLGFLFQGKFGQVKFLIGYAQWIAVFLILLLLVKRMIAGKDKTVTYFYLLSFAVLFLFMQDFSAKIWTLPFLNNYRSTNRLLLFEAFFTAALAALVCRNIHRLVKNNVRRNLLLVSISLFAVFSTIPNWGSRKMIPVNNPNQESSIEAFRVIEYSLLPIWLKNTHFIERKGYVSGADVLKGDAKITKISRTTTKHVYKIIAKSDATIKENTLYFPGWMIKVNGKTTPINYTDKVYSGIMLFNVPKGTNTVEVNFIGSPIRQITLVLSLLILASLLAFPLIRTRLKEWTIA